MSEAAESRLAEEASVRRSPLEAAHARACALMKERDGCLVPAHYGDAGAEYDAVRGGAGAGVFGLSSRGRTSSVQFQNSEVTVARATHTAEDGFDLFVGVDEVEALWDALVASGARPVGFDALEVLRVEAGVPRYGVDATDANVVIEVGDEAEAGSFTKGCYTGQEIIARIHWRGHVAKRLAGLVFDREAEPPTDARIKSCAEDREVGRITSTGFSPRLRRQIALGLVKYDHLAHGTEVRNFNGDSELCAAHVAGLPLVRGSWHADDEGAGACVESGV